jgi:hypothetical protein
MENQPKDSTEEIVVHKDKFDAVLRKMIATQPMPLKDVIGTSPRRKRERDSH